MNLLPSFLHDKNHFGEERIALCVYLHLDRRGLALIAATTGKRRAGKRSK